MSKYNFKFNYNLKFNLKNFIVIKLRIISLHLQFFRILLSFEQGRTFRSPCTCSRRWLKLQLLLMVATNGWATDGYIFVADIGFLNVVAGSSDPLSQSRAWVCYNYQVACCVSTYVISSCIKCKFKKLSLPRLRSGVYLVSGFLRHAT